MVTKQELLEMGARSLLVEIETKKLALLKMFPHLDADNAPSPKKTKAKHRRTIAKKTLRRPKEQHKKTRFDVIADLAANLKTFKLDDVHRELGGSKNSASTACWEAKKRGIIERVGPETYRRAS